MEQVKQNEKEVGIWERGWTYTFLIPFTPLKLVMVGQRQDAWRPCLKILERRVGEQIKTYLMVGGFHYYTAMRLSFWGSR